MANYCTQFYRLKASLPTHTLNVEEFKGHLIRFYGLGSDKKVNKWIDNFQKAGLIKLSLVDGVWLVEIL